MPIPRFRYGGYMESTAGGTNTSASSSYSGSGGGGGGGSSNNSPGHPGNASYNYPTYNSAISPNISGVGTNVSNITGKIIDTKAQEEANEANYLNQVLPGQSGATNFTYQDLIDQQEQNAYNQSKDKQKQMQDAVELAYGLTALKPEQEEERNKSIRAAIAAGKNITSQAGIDQGTSQISNLSHQQIQQLIDSGFVQAENEGVLGGTMGAELVTNKLKKDFSDALQYGDKGAMDEALRALDALNAGIGGAGATKKQYEMGLLNFDPSAVYSFGSDIDVSEYNADGTKSNKSNYLKNAYYNMASKDLKPSQYKNYMNTIGAFGHTAPPASGGGGGGYGYGYGGGGNGGGGYYYGAGMQGQPRQRGQVGPGGLQEQVNQAFLSGGKPFAKGGIVSLVED
tara:strand:+ start:643 stop:1833 length:1191 start_codon:yes stop_codon:yes gene_type:complete